VSKRVVFDTILQINSRADQNKFIQLERGEGRKDYKAIIKCGEYMLQAA
jgi:hypothetical protein